MIEAVRQAGVAATGVALACAEAKQRREHPRRFGVDGTVYRLSSPEPRSFNTWFDVIRYTRSYARPIDGGVGHFPLDLELELFADRISPTLLATGARLATRMSFAEPREILGWFVPEPPSTEVLEQTVLGFGHHTAAWFEAAPVPEEEGEVLVALFDGKCVPTRVGAGEAPRGTGGQASCTVSASPWASESGGSRPATPTEEGRQVQERQAGHGGRHVHPAAAGEAVAGTTES